MEIVTKIKLQMKQALFMFAYSYRLFKKGPVKLIKQVKIAYSILQSVSNQFHFIILILPM